ncbi:MAG: hypothetical protein FD141_794 [Fusobacteria bacterium]|nr:MAG: hypothetical protein FD141_794 [Fusobacteriota bacterium]KAF0228540.1 MAG: hypothetical protein FD182_796 [Fusobacteriota bacterium]
MIRIFLYSIFIGAGGIAPGLSGGTLSIILGIHRKLIDAIECFFIKPMSSIKVLFPAGFGALVGVVFFSVIQTNLLQYYQMQTLFCFIGLMLGSLPFLFKEANKKDSLTKKNLPIRLTLFLAAVFVGLLMVLFDDPSAANNSINLIDSVSFSWNINTIITLLLLGLLISASLIFPGISGTVLLMMIGQYSMVLNLLSGLKDLFIMPSMSVFSNSLPLLPIGIGVLIGVFIFSKVLSVLFCRWHGATYAVILGFVVGSVPALYPANTNWGLDVNTFSSLLLFIAGVVVSYWFGSKGLRLKD